jgi:hypothetical protein
MTMLLRRCRIGRTATLANPAMTCVVSFDHLVRAGE